MNNRVVLLIVALLLALCGCGPQDEGRVANAAGTYSFCCVTSKDGLLEIKVADGKGANEWIIDTRASCYQKYGVALTGISVYAVNLSDPETDTLFHQVEKEVLSHEHVLQIHGFTLDKATSTAVFDLVISFDLKDRKALYDQINEELKKNHPEYTFYVTLDNDISD